MPYPQNAWHHSRANSLRLIAEDDEDLVDPFRTPESESPRIEVAPPVPPIPVHLDLNEKVGFADSPREILLVNPITGERRKSFVRPPESPAANVRRPSLLPTRRESRRSSMYTVVRRDSEAAVRHMSLSQSRRQSQRSMSMSLTPGSRKMSRQVSWASPFPNAAALPTSAAIMSPASGVLSPASGVLSPPAAGLFAPTAGSDKDYRRVSWSSPSRPRNLSTTSIGPHTHTPRKKSRTSSFWSRRTASTSSDTSIDGAVAPGDTVRPPLPVAPASNIFSSAFGAAAVELEQSGQATGEQFSEKPEPPRRRSSLFPWREQSHNPMFGNFIFGRRDSSILPVQEPTPAYEWPLSGDEMIEIPIEEKANTGWVKRRASILQNVFSDADIDVDPDLEFPTEATDAEINHAIQEARTSRGNRKMLWSRNLAIVAYLSMNAGFIAFCFGVTKVWYILIPLVVLSSVVNSLMVLNLTRVFLTISGKKAAQKITGKEPDEVVIIPMNFMTVLPCYNESYEELMGTLDSITNSDGIDMHKQMIIIVCDGKVRGKGQAKTTPQILLEDILTDNSEEIMFDGAYQGWNTERNALWCRRGYYKGIPYICTVKQSNRGKRDGLIMVRNMLYAYNHRNEFNRHTMSPDFFEWCKEWGEMNNFATFDWLVGTDADTIFEPGCIAELYRQCMLDPSCVGTCGLIKVGFRTGKWTFWNLYQNAEYIRGQMLRRLHQSYGTHRVTCLPGACQIIKVCEETCGPRIMDELFGYYPRPMDNLIQQIRSLAGEDRNYVVNMMYAAPNVNTRQAIRAVAFTDPPTSLSVFLSQRRRWTLSTCANDLIVIFDKRMKWFERLCSAADLLTWFLPIFILATVANFLRAAIEHHNPGLLIGLSSVIFLPWLYTFISVLWVPENWEERLQYLAGLLFLAFMGPFMTALVISYAIKNSHVFGWGKTRQLEEGDANSKPAH